MRALLLLLVLGCAGAVEDGPPGQDSQNEVVESAPDAGADAGCGLSFDAAVEAFAPERVCQTTVYRRESGYCTHYVPCSSL